MVQYCQHHAVANADDDDDECDRQLCLCFVVKPQISSYGFGCAAALRNMGLGSVELQSVLCRSSFMPHVCYVNAYKKQEPMRNIVNPIETTGTQSCLRFQEARMVVRNLLLESERPHTHRLWRLV